MGTTPIYGFPYPDPSDLVANYPALGQQLAQDIEDVLPTVPGLQLINTTTFSNQASVSVNNVFTSTYTNYQVLVTQLFGTSAGNTLNARVRSGGTDDTSNNYHNMNTVLLGNGTAENITGLATFAAFPRVSATVYTAMAFLVIAPELARPTIFTGTGLGVNTANTQYAGGNMNVFHAPNTAYDGFTLFAAAGNITGTVETYGIKKA